MSEAVPGDRERESNLVAHIQLLRNFTEAKGMLGDINVGSSPDPNYVSLYNFAMNILNAADFYGVDLHPEDREFLGSVVRANTKRMKGVMEEESFLGIGTDPEGWEKDANVNEHGADMMAERVSSDLNGDSSVLDVCAGTGRMIDRLYSDGRQFFAVDKDPGMIDRMKGKYKERGNVHVGNKYLGKIQSLQILHAYDGRQGVKVDDQRLHSSVARSMGLGQSFYSVGESIDKRTSYYADCSLGTFYHTGTGGFRELSDVTSGFDVAVMHDSAQYFMDPALRGLIKEVAGNLRPGGVFHVTYMPFEANTKDGNSSVRTNFGHLSAKFSTLASPMYVVKSGDFEEWIREAGLTVTDSVVREVYKQGGRAVNNAFVRAERRE